MPGQTTSRRRPARSCEPSFNGGPGTCPAKLRALRRVRGLLVVPSMEGRARARPNDPADGRLGGGLEPSMEGRARARPNSTGERPLTMNKPVLQWWAGHVPGQTWGQSEPSGGETCLQWRAGHVPGQTAEDAGHDERGAAPSMEGRARARPNDLEEGTLVSWSDGLQWRAGHVPGQTSPESQPTVDRRSAFNGGPGTCPAKRNSDRWMMTSDMAFNGGPGPCPAKQRPRRDHDRPTGPPSMEGRARARPNPNPQLQKKT